MPGVLKGTQLMQGKNMEAPQLIGREGHEARGGECGVNDVLNFLESERDAIKFMIAMARLAQHTLLTVE